MLKTVPISESILASSFAHRDLNCELSSLADSAVAYKFSKDSLSLGTKSTLFFSKGICEGDRERQPMPQGRLLALHPLKHLGRKFSNTS